MKDDQKYLELMALYKKLRLFPERVVTSQKVLEIALEVKRLGKVSEEAIKAARYL